MPRLLRARGLSGRLATVSPHIAASLRQSSLRPIAAPPHPPPTRPPPPPARRAPPPARPRPAPPSAPPAASTAAPARDRYIRCSPARSAIGITLDVRPGIPNTPAPQYPTHHPRHSATPVPPTSTASP